MHDSFLMNSHKKWRQLAVNTWPHVMALDYLYSILRPTLMERQSCFFFLKKRLSNTAILNLCLILLTYLITRHKLPFFLKKYLSIQYLGYYFMKVCQWYDAEQLRFCTIFQLFLWKSNCTLRFQCSMTKLCALSKGYSLHSEMLSCLQCDLLLDIAFIFILLFFKFPVWILI